MAIKKVLVLFKTHLDIGFTDFSAKVVEKYMESFIPNSVRVAKELRESGEDARLVWTTGSWLIHEYLRTHTGPEGDKVREAIENGDVRWHGLPFTTHTELMPKSLFEYGLSLSGRLDKQFGKKTIAAKMTDVPGHTKAIIPSMKKAGIEFLHLGVNPASTVPCVPPLFRWQADNGDMINVMYQGDYGDFDEIGNTGVAIYFAHTGDNQGVQSPDAIIDIFKGLHEKLPDAQIVAADLNDVALVVREIEDTLPIVTDEIGDSWIHGVGTDPKKVSGFKALCRLYEELPDGEDKEALARGLIMIPEHTWGVNINKHLGDRENYDKELFNELRQKAPNYKMLEASWREQRAYLTDAVNNLSDENREKALKLLAETERENGHTCDRENIPAGTEIKLGDYTFIFNQQGEIVHLEKGGKIIADKKHRLLSLIYEQFSANEYKRFYTQYNRLDITWAREDFTKPGIENGTDCYKRYEPEKAAVYNVGDKLFIRYFFPKKAHTECGCPLMFDLYVSVNGDELLFDLAWFCKPANRVAEALWVGFRPIATNKRISKLGQLIDPKAVVENGQCRLHATDFGVVYDELSIETVDIALVAPQEPSLLNFCNTKPLDSDGINFNLVNNIWGTNFPMWYEDDARFRFILKLK